MKSWWLVFGNLAFGFTVGLFTGLSETPVVSGVMPLLFTFAGGSVIALSVTGNRTVDDLDLLGAELLAFSIGCCSGAFVGAKLRQSQITILKSHDGS